MSGRVSALRAKHPAGSYFSSACSDFSLVWGSSERRIAIFFRLEVFFCSGIEVVSKCFFPQLCQSLLAKIGQSHPVPMHRRNFVANSDVNQMKITTKIVRILVRFSLELNSRQPFSGFSPKNS